MELKIGDKVKVENYELIDFNTLNKKNKNEPIKTKTKIKNGEIIEKYNYGCLIRFINDEIRCVPLENIYK